MNVGLIGCGGIAPAHIQAYHNNEDINVIALCDLDIVRANTLAKRFGVKQTYDNYWDMIDKHDLDIVDISTPVTTHAPIVCDIAKAVPAIYLEKPMARHLHECDAIFKEIEKHGTKLCIGHGQIHAPLIKKVKERIDHGDFDLYSLKMTQKESFEFLNKNDLAPEWNVQEKQGGILWEVCAHLVYLQLHFIPKIMEVYALGGKTNYPVYDNFSVLLKSSEEKFGLIELSWVAEETEIIYEFTGIDGRRMKIFRDYNYLGDYSEKPPINVGGILRNMYVDEKRAFKKWYNFTQCFLQKCKVKPIYNLIEEFVKSIKNDDPPPVTAQDGRNTINLLECIEKSLDQNRPIKLK